MKRMSKITQHRSMLNSRKPVKLTLHGTYPSVGKEKPVQQGEVVLGISRVEREFVILVELLSQVEKNGGGLENRKVIVYDGRNSTSSEEYSVDSVSHFRENLPSIGVDLCEPW
jgi:hypothetical protein